MNFGIRELLTSFVALAALPVFFLLPGYGVAWCTNLLQFRTKSLTERLVWGVALSVPASLMACLHPGLPLSPRAASLLLLLWDAFALSLLLSDLRRSRTWRQPALWPQGSRTGLVIGVGLPLYVVLSSVPVVWHRQLFESAIWQDWCIRIQLVNAAIRGGNSPGNPMFAISGHAAPLRYYFYWYVLCARMHDLVPVDSRALFATSCAGAGLASIAFLLLSVKYLLHTALPIRRVALAALLASCILGLDLLALLASVLHHRFYPDVQFWLDDRSPGWLHMVLWSPHHLAGFVCCGVGTLLLIYTWNASRRKQALHAALAGSCFAVALGTSSFTTLLFALACLFIALDAMLRRQWDVVCSVALATVIAAPLAAPFLLSFLHTPAGAPGGAGHHALVQVRLRYNNQASSLIWHELQRMDKSLHGLPSPGDPQYLRVHRLSKVLRIPLGAGLLVSDFGFFLFVFFWQLREELLTPGDLNRQSRILWLVFVAFAVPGFLLSSAGLQSNNDLGRHAGFGMRYVLTLWAAPFLVRSWERRNRPIFVDARRHAAVRPTLSFPTRIAIAFAGLGLLGQISQVVLTRVRFMLVNAGVVSRYVVEERIARPAFRFAQIQSAMQAASRATPPGGLVQSNPHARLHNVFLLYTDKQAAAADDGCNTPFGGDPAACAPEARALVALFGGTGPHFQGASEVLGEEIPFNQAGVTSLNFAAVCSRLKLNVVVASYLDPAWWHRESWIWQLDPLFSNATARVFACPALQPTDPLASAVPQSPERPYTGF